MSDEPKPPHQYVHFGICKLTAVDCPEVARADCRAMVKAAVVDRPETIGVIHGTLLARALEQRTAAAAARKHRFMAGLAPGPDEWYGPNSPALERLPPADVAWIGAASPTAVTQIVKEHMELGSAYLRQGAEKRELAKQVEALQAEVEKLKLDVDACAGVGAAQTKKRVEAEDVAAEAWKQRVELEAALADARAEKHELIGYISAGDGWSDKHPDECLAWWNRERAARKAREAAGG